MKIKDLKAIIANEDPEKELVVALNISGYEFTLLKANKENDKVKLTVEDSIWQKQNTN